MLDNELKSYLLPNLFNAAVRAGAAIMQVYKNKEDYDISIKSDKTLRLPSRTAGRTKRSRPIWDLPVFRF
jgi:3'(2'), 5'-bisphosphate nucleotidase